jgi:5,10-methylenetetrahydrofolate reductase
LQSDLIGAHALGVRNILALTGDPPSAGRHTQHSTPVYDVDSIGLVRIIDKL